MKLHSLLDVGCGNAPLGTVNCDLYVRPCAENNMRTLDTKKIANFVQCEACKLPFRDNGFDAVVANHILEHLISPFEALKEWHRVARLKVIVAVPSVERFKFSEEPTTHIYSWSVTSLQHLMDKVFPRVVIRPTLRYLVWGRKGKLPTLANFVLKRFLSYIPTFHKPDLIGVGYVRA